MVSATFGLKCVICGNRETLEVQGGDPQGPSCSKCYGPMVVERASAVKQLAGKDEAQTK